jgi:hypothetical protein
MVMPARGGFIFGQILRQRVGRPSARYLDLCQFPDAWVAGAPTIRMVTIWFLLTLNLKRRLVSLHSICLCRLLQIDQRQLNRNRPIRAAQIQEPQDGSISIFGRLPCLE